MFVPQLILDQTTVPFQVISIRILASFSYHGSSSGYWSVIISTFLIFSFLITLTSVGVPEKTLSYARMIGFQEFFIQFFYWVFCMKYSPLYFEEIRSNLLEMNLVLFSGLIIISGIFYWISKLHMIKMKSVNEEVKLSTMFECPYCHKEYHAVISYCIACKKQIN
jgi:hypothetical protein